MAHPENKFWLRSCVTFLPRQQSINRSLKMLAIMSNCVLQTGTSFQQMPMQCDFDNNFRRISVITYSYGLGYQLWKYLFNDSVSGQGCNKYERLCYFILKPARTYSHSSKVKGRISLSCRLLVHLNTNRYLPHMKRRVVR